MVVCFGQSASVSHSLCSVMKKYHKMLLLKYGKILCMTCEVKKENNKKDENMAYHHQLLLR